MITRSDLYKLLAHFVDACWLLSAPCSCLLNENASPDLRRKPAAATPWTLAFTVFWMSLGERIRAAIDAKGLKDNWVADGAGISKTALSNIITGVTENPGVFVIAAIADVLDESVDALLGRPGHPLLRHEQETLRTAANLINQRVLPSPNEQKVAMVTRPHRRQRRRGNRVPIGRAAATPRLQLFTDVRELPRHQIPKDFRDRGIHRVFTVEGASMIGAGLEPGDLLYVRTDVLREQANGQIVVVRYGDYECVKRLRIAADGTVTLESEPPRSDDVTLTSTEAEDLDVYGTVVHRLTHVRQ